MRSSSGISAVLLSGGLDSAVLLAEEAVHREVQPLYVSAGLAWERAERQAVARLLASGAIGPQVKPLATLTVDMTDVYPSAHWAIRGTPPAYNTPDEDVYLPGRNIVLLGKAGIYCAMAGISRLAVGTLDHNPFPDATPAFRAAMQAALALGLDRPLQIEAPFATLSKVEVVRRGMALGTPLGLTLSCMNPTGPFDNPGHCGACSKCRERHDAFVEAGIPDPTHYADRQYVGGPTA
jgi:7-cyano-7-deazaguanine synthase